MRVYYDRDADVGLIKKKKVVIVGYGSQGHAHAANLKDSGVAEVAVALRSDSSSRAKAADAGFKVMDVAEAAAWGDMVMMLTPDELQADIYRDEIAANIRPGAAIVFAAAVFPASSPFIRTRLATPTRSAFPMLRLSAVAARASSRPPSRKSARPTCSVSRPFFAVAWSS